MQFCVLRLNISSLCQCLKSAGWSQFDDWSSCSAECGGGTQTRIRTCLNPAPVDGGADCQGDPEETRACNTDDCVQHEGKDCMNAYTRVGGCVGWGIIDTPTIEACIEVGC